jgi:DinB superfamily
MSASSIAARAGSPISRVSRAMLLNPTFRTADRPPFGAYRSVIGLESGMVRYLTRRRYENDTPPQTDTRDPATLVEEAVADVVARAESWLGWDGQPALREGNVWTPHKVLRRVTDHLLDHLAELECRLAQRPTIPDRWHGRMATTDADFARFTEIDLDEATSRLTRLAACYHARLSTVADADLDARPEGGGWTLRQLVHHVAHVNAYADMLAPGHTTAPPDKDA